MKAEEYRRMHVRKFAKQVKAKVKAEAKRKRGPADPREINYDER